MRLARRAWLCLASAVVLATLGPCCRAEVQSPATAQLLIAADASPPAADRAWQQVALPDSWPRSRPSQDAAASWYAIAFEAPANVSIGAPWAVYLPYLAEGGQLWLNGALLARIEENTAARHVRWIRPHLVKLPPSLLRAGSNTLLVNAAPPPAGAATRFPRVDVGPEADLVPTFDRRMFWVSTLPQITSAVCLLLGTSVLLIWARRRGEVVYGLFGAAVVLWGLRTLTFVVEVMPTGAWLGWRFAYFAATGGFIVLLAFVAMRLAGVRVPWLERALLAYWIAGPAFLLAGGLGAEPWINRYWVAGLLPIGAVIMGVSAWALWRWRTVEAAALPAALVVGVLAGVHDYLVAWDVAPGSGWFATWAAQRLQLLHQGAIIVLLTMGALLTLRFIRTLGALESLNQTLETRVAQRETELAGNYLKLFALEREQAALQERQRIMRELHDGLGSQLFVALSRAERGEGGLPEVADALRACIADMRLALDTLGPEQQDFRATLGDFLFRWQRLLQEHGVHPAWEIDVPDEALQVQPHAALQLLRVAQEALTNTLKHARATRVQVRLVRTPSGLLELEVRDNGCGVTPAASGARGRGIVNMRTRAELLGGRLEVRSDAGGTCVAVQVPLATVAA